MTGEPLLGEPLLAVEDVVLAVPLDAVAATLEVVRVRRELVLASAGS